MSRRILRSALLAATFLAAAAPGRSGACGFHATLPPETLSQRIAASVALIAARPAPEDPFRFAAVRYLKGPPSPSAPPHLVDAATRRLLARAPDSTVLFARDADGAWSRLLTLDDATRPVVERLVERAEAWSLPTGAAERRDFAAGLLAHKDGRLARLALGELDALDYGVLRSGSYPLAPETVLAGIAAVGETAYAPVRILLLGILGGAAAETEIARQIRSRVETGTAHHLGAWATAAIEAGGADGLVLVERALAASDRPPTPDQLAGITGALVLQRARGDATLRTPLKRALLRLAARHPAAAPLMSQALAASPDRSQGDLVRALLAARAYTSAGDILAASAYLAGAPAEAAGGSPLRSAFGRDGAAGGSGPPVSPVAREAE